MAASDEIIWQIINQQFCSFKLKTTKQQNFCRNEYNVSGLCNRQSCPLANSSYATVRQPDLNKATIYLYMKTPERAHLPSKLWERIKLSNNYEKALKQLDDRLAYISNSKFLIHRCKARLTRLLQVNLRMRRIAAEDERLGEKLVPKLAPKIAHREKTRERKALNRAQLERAIERELIERLRQGAYGEQPLNVSQTIWEKVLKNMEREGAAVRDKDLDKGIEDEAEGEEDKEREEEEEDGLEGEVEYVSDVEESDAEELADIEDWLGSEEDDDEAEEDEEEESEEEAPMKNKKSKAGDKRKRGRAVRTKARKRMETEVEETSRQKLLAF
ncbi:hypothetical protein P8C59_007244 [Phyllachora maydis]|uniref:Protein MAK16 n=1 Tax=Phyllachora maydis TaxID=1825666 RepID=A0AAD9I9A0_9PEZI|nr:hypothetical protein P8C59_007244 [Phyllachora maydis]